MVSTTVQKMSVILCSVRGACLAPQATFGRQRTLGAFSQWKQRSHLTYGHDRPRSRSTVAGEGKSGHIKEGPNESILFLESRVLAPPYWRMQIDADIGEDVFPLKLRLLLSLPFFTDPDKSLQRLLDQVHHQRTMPAVDPMAISRKALPDFLPIQITKVLPRLKEGGAYVKFTHDPTVSPLEIETTLQKFLKEQPIKPWFSPLRRVRSFLVHGRPWLEDLHRFPNPKLMVEFISTTTGFEASALSEEMLYSLFRKYGKLVDIVPQPVGSKDLPRYAILSFSSIRHAITAKNCMHGYTVLEPEAGEKAGTVLKIAYMQRMKAHIIRDWIFSHPRIVIPILAALLATVTVAIFDPYVRPGEL